MAQLSNNRYSLWDMTLCRRMFNSTHAHSSRNTIAETLFCTLTYTHKLNLRKRFNDKGIEFLSFWPKILCLLSKLKYTLPFASAAASFLIFIIIILSCCQTRYPWPSLTTPPNRSSFLAGPQGYILYPQYVGSDWSPCFCSDIWEDPSENITYELVPASQLTLMVFVMGGRYYLPTPPLGQDMTQGQFLSGV